LHYFAGILPSSPGQTIRERFGRKNAGLSKNKYKIEENKIIFVTLQNIQIQVECFVLVV